MIRHYRDKKVVSVFVRFLLLHSTITVYEALDNGRKKCWAVLVIEDEID
jgi:hypothetical protein